MTLPTTEQIAQLSHAELVALVTELLRAVQRLEAENKQLKAELAKAPPPPPTSHNSSQSPAREVKRNLATNRKRKKHGPPLGMRGRRERGWQSRTGLLRRESRAVGTVRRICGASSRESCFGTN